MDNNNTLPLELRTEYKEKYLRAMRGKQSTLTAAPFFSLKTLTIRQALASVQNAVLFDLRAGIHSLKPKKGIEHVFIDAIEIVRPEELKRLLSSLKDQGITSHLITHLYYYENARELLPEARMVFPQLLKEEDVKEIKKLFNSFPETEKSFAHRFVDYFEGWPAVAHTLDSPEKLEIMRRFAEGLALSKKAEPEAYFRKLIEKYLKFYFEWLNKAKAVNKELAGRKFAVPDKLWQDYISARTDLKSLVEEIDPALWHFTKFGYLWLDEESAELRVPPPLADIA